MRENYVARCRPHEVANASSLDVRAKAQRRVNLGNNHHAVTFGDAQMTGLVEFVSDTLHDRQCFGDHALGRRILLRQLKQAQGQAKALAVARLGDVAGPRHSLLDPNPSGLHRHAR